MNTPETQAQTPRTDAHTYGGKGVIGAGYVHADFARQLERELSAATAENARLREALNQIAEGEYDCDCALNTGLCIHGIRIANKALNPAHEG